MDEKSHGPEHPDVALALNNLAQLLQTTNRLQEAEPLSRRAAGIMLAFTRKPRAPAPAQDYCQLQGHPERGEAEIEAEIGALA